MFVFIDESGDIAVPGKTDFFALSAVVFATEAERDGLQEAMLALRQDWGKKRDFEFKFSKMGDQRLEQCFAAAAKLPFRYSSCLLLKGEEGEDMTGEWAKKTYRYERVIREVVGGLAEFFKEADALLEDQLRVFVVHDRHTDPDYCKLLQAEFRKLHSKNGQQMLKGFKPGKAPTSPIFQFVDLVAGAVRHDTSVYCKLIAAKLLKSVNLP